MGKKKKKKLPFRLNILFLAVFLLFSALILRLGVVQIVYGESFKNEVERTENVTVNNSVPRGKIYDRNGTLIVDNRAVKAITYTKSQQVSQDERLQIAEKLATMIDKSIENIPVRDKKDFWILKNREAAMAKLTEREKEELDDKDQYKLILDRITDNEINSFTDQELEVLAVKREMDGGYAFSTQIIKNDDVKNEEFAVVSSNLEKLPGVDTTTDWERQYPYGGTFSSILGSVTTSEQGLPADQLDYYSSKGYERNDRVGKTFLEYQYEDVLRGRKEKVKYVTDKAGNELEKETVSEGRRGNDLQLTIDISLQQEVEKIVEEELKKAKGAPGNNLLDRAFAVMMDPKTGEILAMTGKQYLVDNGKGAIQDYSFGIMSTQYEVGSAIKGATVLAGYDSGAISPGQVFVDQPIHLADTPVKKSYTTMGPINDLTALRRSSNVYMFKTVMAMAGKYYYYDMPLGIKEKYYRELRNYYAQFGLGVKTGIDLPNESPGLKGQYTSNGGIFLDMSIGQYDTYTPLQLAQYVSTIANGGYRMKPLLVKEIYEPGDGKSLNGKIVKKVEPEVLNKLSMDPKYIDRVQEGFRQVYLPGGTAGSYFSKPPYSQYRAAGKTGTAEAPYYGPRKEFHGEIRYNLTLVGYAPFDNPEVAFSVVVPWVDDGYPVNKYIGQRILHAYFQSKEGKLAGPDKGTEDVQE